MKPAATWPQYDVEANAEFGYSSSVSQCDAAIQRGFLRKVFGLVATQLALTVTNAAPQSCGLIAGLTAWTP